MRYGLSPYNTFVFIDHDFGRNEHHVAGPRVVNELPPCKGILSTGWGPLQLYHSIRQLIESYSEVIDGMTTVHIDIHITYWVAFVRPVRPQVYELVYFLIFDAIDGKRHVTVATGRIGDYLGIGNEPDSIKLIDLLKGNHIRITVQVLSRIVLGAVAEKR